MNILLALISCLPLLTKAGGDERIATQNLPVEHGKATDGRPAVETANLNLFDTARGRTVPVMLYAPPGAAEDPGRRRSKLKLAVISHGYGGKNTDYSFIAANLVAHGYLVASIQHHLPNDEPLPTSGNPYEVRMPNWQRGVGNILFVIREIKTLRPDVDFESLLLVGHSNGGDTSMLFAREHPKLVREVITLDNRRMPIPRTKRPRILSIRSSDQQADAGVLPTTAAQKKFGIIIIRLDNTMHDDMWDGATEGQKREINEIISRFLHR
ncbi:MAG: alpha/beta hydrolase [Pyrinomonadaceae bacterium]